MALNFVEVVGIAAAAPVMDWLAVTRLAAFYSDLDYRYWPITKVRLVTLGSVTFAFLLVGIFADPVSPPFWALIIGIVAVIAWVSVMVRDITAQRETGYRSPPRYSERDY